MAVGDGVGCGVVGRVRRQEAGPVVVLLAVGVSPVVGVEAEEEEEIVSDQGVGWVDAGTGGGDSMNRTRSCDDEEVMGMVCGVLRSS